MHDPESAKLLQDIAITMPQNHPASILVAEDDEHISHLLNFMLKREKYTVHLARDGREAKHFIEKNAPPAIVLLDVMLPFFDGFSLLGILRQQAAWKATPVIMLTAKTQEQDIVRALSAGANDYVLKPFQPAELLARIKRLSLHKP